MLGYSVHRFKKEEHYALMSRWYEKRDFPLVPEKYLPEIGLVAMHDGAFVVMGQLYRTDGGIASISHLVSSPVATSEERHIGLDLVISNLMKIAEDQKYHLVTVATNLEKLFPRFENFGFKKTDEKVTHFGRQLWLGV